MAAEPLLRFVCVGVCVGADRAHESCLLGCVGRRWLVRIDVLLLTANRVILGLCGQLFLRHGRGDLPLHEVCRQLWLHIPQLDAVLIHVLDEL